MTKEQFVKQLSKFELYDEVRFITKHNGKLGYIPVNKMIVTEDDDFFTFTVYMKDKIYLLYDEVIGFEIIRKD